MDCAKQVMSREAFFMAVVMSGYAKKKTAVKYAGDRDAFTDDDLIEVYRIEQNVKESGQRRQELFRPTHGTLGDGRTSKRYSKG